jgi:aspartyl-tRNA(Asn)/glutamyl-tRNA(Gln) amidotransferase subunit C
LKLKYEELLTVAKLARIDLSEEEASELAAEISGMLSACEVLGEMDVSELPPTVQPVKLYNVIKDDTVKPSLPREEALANAPSRDGEFFKVRQVLDK